MSRPSTRTNPGPSDDALWAPSEPRPSVAAYWASPAGAAAHGVLLVKQSELRAGETGAVRCVVWGVSRAQAEALAALCNMLLDRARAKPTAVGTEHCVAFARPPCVLRVAGARGAAMAVPADLPLTTDRVWLTGLQASYLNDVLAAIDAETPTAACVAYCKAVLAGRNAYRGVACAKKAREVAEYAAKREQHRALGGAAASLPAAPAVEPAGLLDTALLPAAAPLFAHLCGPWRYAARYQHLLRRLTEDARAASTRLPAEFSTERLLADAKAEQKRTNRLLATFPVSAPARLGGVGEPDDDDVDAMDIDAPAAGQDVGDDDDANLFTE